MKMKLSRKLLFSNAYKQYGYTNIAALAYDRDRYGYVKIAMLHKEKGCDGYFVIPWSRYFVSSDSKQDIRERLYDAFNERSPCRKKLAKNLMQEAWAAERKRAKRGG